MVKIIEKTNAEIKEKDLMDRIYALTIKIVGDEGIIRSNPIRFTVGDNIYVGTYNKCNIEVRVTSSESYNDAMKLARGYEDIIEMGHEVSLEKDYFENKG